MDFRIHTDQSVPPLHHNRTFHLSNLSGLQVAIHVDGEPTPFVVGNYDLSGKHATVTLSAGNVHDSDPKYGSEGVEVFADDEILPLDVLSSLLEIHEKLKDAKVEIPRELTEAITHYDEIHTVSATKANAIRNERFPRLQFQATVHRLSEMETHFVGFETPSFGDWNLALEAQIEKIQGRPGMCLHRLKLVSNHPYIQISEEGETSHRNPECTNKYGADH